jgi:prophage DNA circulation protein
MAAIRDIHNVWRDALVPASFKGALFHVETSQRAGGRRVVVHTYPKRNIPYSEDMGREPTRWTFNGYLIHGDRGFPGNLLSQIAILNTALDSDDAGLLIHPLIGSMLVMCERWSYADKRDKGGFIEYDMQFVEAGSPALVGMSDAGSGLDGQASASESTGVSSINNATTPLQSGAGQIAGLDRTPGTPD